MSPWVRLDVHPVTRTRWQRLKHRVRRLVFGIPGHVHITTQIADGVVHGVVQDAYEDRRRIIHAHR